VADALKREPDVQVNIVDGNKGEFTVNVDGRAVAHKADQMPTVEEVVAAVRRQPTISAAKAS
jgi:hypothetical protein